MEERTGFEEYIRCDKRVSAFNGPSAKRKDIKSFLVVFTLYVSLDCVILHCQQSDRRPISLSVPRFVRKRFLGAP